MSSEEYCIAMTTTDSEEKAVELARKVVAAKLAACAQLINIRSIFVWEGSTDDAAEILILLKTRTAVYDDLQKFISENHSYDVPEVLQVPVTGGFGPYLSWMNENTQTDK